MVAADNEGENEAVKWKERFLSDLSVLRAANTVRAYREDIERWLAFCAVTGVHPLQVGPRIAIAFVRSELERVCGKEKTVSPRTVVRRLSAVRQWYAYLALEPDLTGIPRNPIPAGNAVRTGAGLITGQLAPLRYDEPLPDVLSREEIERFVGALTSTGHRDRAIVAILKDGGVRISEVLSLRLDDIDWSRHTLKIRSAKSRSERLVPVSEEAITILAEYVRFERPKPLAHDYVFVNLGRRGYGQPFCYRSWVAICEKARDEANTPNVHAHAFRHTFATNMAEAGMPLDALQRILGHRHVDTVMVYNRVRNGRVYREYQEAMAVQRASRQLAETEGKEGGRT